MATTQDYIEFVCDQAHRAGIPVESIHHKKMFGEYMVYVNDKPVLLVCDNTVFVKQVDSIAELMAAADRVYPYSGAKEHYILAIEESKLVQAVISELEKLTPVPKRRKKKAKSAPLS
jgi:TfoX/Sxy family transcriptional regulator of competence genes